MSPVLEPIYSEGSNEMPRKPEVGEILYITDKDKNLNGISEDFKLSRVKVIKVNWFNERNGLWHVNAQTVNTPLGWQRKPTFSGYIGETFLPTVPEPIEKTTCPICRSEEDFCICKLLM